MMDSSIAMGEAMNLCRPCSSMRWKAPKLISAPERPVSMYLMKIWLFTMRSHQMAQKNSTTEASPNFVLPRSRSRK